MYKNNYITIKPLIISRIPPHLGGREVMVQSLINFFDVDSAVSVLSPDTRLKNGNIVNSSLPKEDILIWAKRQKPTIINCHTFYIAELATYLSKELKVPLVFTFHGVFVDFYDKKYKDLIRLICKSSDAVVTVSDSYNKRLKKFLYNSRKIVTIKNGVDFKAIQKFRAGKLKYIPPDKFTVTIPARLTPFKGLEYLISAVNALDDRFYFVIASPKGRFSKEEVEYKNRLMRISKSNNLIFKELSNLELLGLLKNSNLVILPSILEGISISILEAMASGNIVIATRVGGNREIIKDGYNGFLIEKESPIAISNAIERVYGMKRSYRNKIISNAKETILNDFSSEEMFDNYVKLFYGTIKKYDNKH